MTGIHEKNSERDAFLSALQAGAFMAADRFAEESGEKCERFYLLAAHEFLAQFIASCGGPYCNHLGIIEMGPISQWVRRITQRIEEFSRSDQREAKLIKAMLLDQLVHQGTSPARAEGLSIPLCTEEIPPKVESTDEALSPK